MRLVGSSTVRVGRILTRVCAIAAGCIALASAVAWASDKWSLTTLGPDDVPMAPSTAALLVLLAIATLFRSYSPERRASMWTSWVVVATTVTLAVIVVAAKSLHFAVPLEELLAPSPPSVSGVPVGRMSPLTAFTFLCAAGGLGLGTASSRIYRLVGYVLASGAFLIGVTVVLGYAAGVPPLYGGSMVPMAFSTALAFASLGLALLVAAHPDPWWPRAGAEAPSTAGQESARRFDIAVAMGTLTIVLVICFSGIVLVRSQLARGREEAKAALETIADLKVAEVSAWRRE